MQITLSSRSHLGTILTRQRADRRAHRRKVGFRPMSEKGPTRTSGHVRARSVHPLDSGHAGTAAAGPFGAKRRPSAIRKNASYSISSSEMLSKPDEMVRPSALAVFMLMASSNLVGCSTGRSAGFLPIRIWPVRVPPCRYRSTDLAP